VAGPPLEKPQAGADSAPATAKVVYNDRIARQFALASLVWGAFGMAVGLLVALELAFWPANLTPYLSFGRVRPVHTHTVIFAFAGNLIFAGIHYSSQRLLAARLPSDRLASLHFWLWQLVAAAAVVTLPLGFTQGKEYAELEWPIDIATAIAWLVFSVHFFLLIARRARRRLPIAIWFYLATLVPVTAAHLVNSLAVPVGLLKSYSLFGGVEDALVQWWYGHGGVTLFLVVPVLGLMYFFLPRAAERPIHSHRLAIVHFWALLFLFAWTAPQHLLNTALPDWAQSAGTAFGLLLWAPSWAGVLNGLLTLRGAWSRLRGDPVLRFFAAALLFYGLAALEAPVLGLKTVSGLAHYTDWVIGHVHTIALGWDGFMAAGILYWMVPRLYGTRLHSPAAAGAHFYMATVGILVYLSAMWIAGATQGLMWRAEGRAGGLAYGFVETLAALHITYWARVGGGSLYLAGFLVMGWNLYRTMRSGRAVDGESEVAPDAISSAAMDRRLASVPRLLFAQPVLIAAMVIGLAIAAGFANPFAAVVLLFVAFFVSLGWLASVTVLRDRSAPGWHERLETRALAFGLLVSAASLSGAIVELVPVLASGPRAVAGESGTYSPLQLEGRDIYLAEGCYTCHSQMVRPFVWEVARYGEVSTASESAYDHPFQWGSRRIGPDLARIGGRYPNLWHYQHLIDPRAVTLGSTMPLYDHLAAERVDFAGTPAKMRALRSAGVPYSDREIAAAVEASAAEARAIAADLEETGQVEVAPDSAMVALIAYLQRLGQVPAPSPAPATAPAAAPAVPAPEAKP
jgi:cytochrome c oxidase cbb3-type subunit I/II